MSHTTTVRTVPLTSRTAIEAAAAAMGLSAPLHDQTVRLFDGSTYTGTSLRLPGWHYPVVIEASGVARFDNYNGAWGDLAQFEKFSQHYSVEVLRETAALQGYVVEVTTAADGTMTVEMFQ